MKDDILQKLQQLIKEELRLIKDHVELIKKKVEQHDLFLHTTADNVRTIKDQQSIINEKLDEHTKILENQVLPSVVTIETEIKVYADMYKVNNSNGRKLKQRVEALEENAGIVPPSGLIFIEVS